MANFNYRPMNIKNRRQKPWNIHDVITNYAARKDKNDKQKLGEGETQPRKVL